MLPPQTEKMVMFMENKFPKRKHPRLKSYDYSEPGAYFITICTHNKQCLLSRVVGRGLAPAEVQYTAYGQIAREQLLRLESRYPNAKIDQYVIMPNHIHAIILLEEPAGANSICAIAPGNRFGLIRCAEHHPRPTIPDIVCAYKSLTTKACKKAQFVGKLFQTSYYEHIIRGSEDYDQIAAYIANNPKQWELDTLYAAE